MNTVFITSDLIDQWSQSFDGCPERRLAQNAMTKVFPAEVLISQNARTRNTHVFSNKIPKEAKVSDQKSTGRCWQFAALNAMRLKVIEKHNLDTDFELSHSYLFFWDKLERANWFLEMIIELPDEPVDSRLMQWTLGNENLSNDGGQWDMLVNLINKYGVVPKSAYPETKTGERSLYLNRFLKNILRGFACELHKMQQRGCSEDALKERKMAMLNKVFDILMIHFGRPPLQFDWEFQDKDKNFGAVRGITPLQFYREHCDYDVDAYVSIVNDPRHEYYATYTVDRLGNVVGGKPVLYLNLPSDDLKRYSKQTIDAGDAVWFGCDVGKEHDRDLGVLDASVHDYELVYGIKPNMTKAERLMYGESMMTHAMLLTAYHEEPNSELPTKWRVENTWGEKSGNKGYLVMTNEWFDEFMFQICVKKDLLDDQAVEGLSKEPQLLPAWDPMGTLATSDYIPSFEHLQQVFSHSSDHHITSKM